MTQEEKNLLLRDLCARLPYELKGLQRGKVQRLLIMDSFGSYQVDGYNAWFSLNSVEFKPYLRHMSSMTKEEKEKYRKVCELDTEILSKHPMDETPFPALYNSQDWLNENHFDYRGLIEKGLALEAPENMYK